MVKVFINNSAVVLQDNLSILQACKFVGIQIPRFCYHDQLSIAGNCRMCLVELENSVKPVASCALKVSNGMRIYTNTSIVIKAREGVMEFLLLNHPLDCPICDQGGECDLQDQALLFGKDRGRFYDSKRSVGDKDCGPLIKTVMTRCIHCTRCVRFLKELGGVHILGTTGRGSATEVGSYISKSIMSEISGNLIDICPVGALTSKPYSYTARSWELRQVESIDISDNMCSNISLSFSSSRIYRVLPVLNSEINQEWITDKTRFGYDGFFKKRLDKCYFKKVGYYERLTWLEAYKGLFYLFNNVTVEDTSCIVSSKLSVEAICSLKNLQNFGALLSVFGGNLDYFSSLDFRSNFIFNEGLSGVSKADIVVLCGINLRVEQPLLLLRLRKEQVTRGLVIFSFGSLDGESLFVNNIGNTMSSFYKFVFGQHLLCSIFLKKKRPLLFVGSSFLEQKQLKLIDALLKKIPSLSDKVRGWRGLSIINTGVTFGSQADLLLDKVPLSKGYTKKGYKNVFNFHSNKYIVDSPESKRIVYLGSHGGSSLFSNYLNLPVKSVIELSEHFLNFEGRLQSTQSLLKGVGDSVEVSNIVKNIELVVSNRFEKKGMDTLHKAYNISNFVKNLKGYSVVQQPLNNNCLHYKVKNTLFGYYTREFYKVGSSFCLSPTLQKCREVYKLKAIKNFR